MQRQKDSLRGARGFVFPYAKQSRGGSLGRCSKAEMSPRTPVHSVTVLLINSSRLAILMPVPSASRLAWSSAPQQIQGQEELGRGCTGPCIMEGTAFP